MALLALAPDGSPIGVARAVRLVEDRRAADLAVSVIDACHRRGVGTRLVRRLCDEAAGVGIERLAGLVLSDHRLASTLGPRLVEARGIVPGMSVLDVAAGTGNASIAAALRGAQVTASDLTPELLEGVVAGPKPTGSGSPGSRPTPRTCRSTTSHSTSSCRGSA